MTTVSIRVDAVGRGIRAFINVESSGCIWNEQIREPYSEDPYFILDGARHDLDDDDMKLLVKKIYETRKKRGLMDPRKENKGYLSDHEKKRLREAIADVKAIKI